MAQVSKKPLSQKVKQKLWGNLIHLMKENNSSKEVTILLNSLITKTEKIMLSKRIMVFILLLSDWPVRAISKYLHVGTPTIYKLQMLLEKDKSFAELIRKTFPRKIQYKKKKETQNNFLLDLLDDIWVGRNKRGRLIYGDPTRKN